MELHENGNGKTDAAPPRGAVCEPCVFTEGDPDYPMNCRDEDGRLLTFWEARDAGVTCHGVNCPSLAGDEKIQPQRDDATWITSGVLWWLVVSLDRLARVDGAGVCILGAPYKRDLGAVLGGSVCEGQLHKNGHAAHDFVSQRHNMCCRQGKKSIPVTSPADSLFLGTADGKPASGESVLDGLPISEPPREAMPQRDYADTFRTVWG